MSEITVRVLDLRITIAGSEPEIWRRVLVPTTASLHKLHQIIQTIFGWKDYHLYGFEVGGNRYEAPMDEGEGFDSKRTKLSSLHLKPGDRFEYVYDFGDDWLHEILVLERPTARPASLPWLVDGARAGPLEDSGGISSYNELVVAHEDRKGGRSPGADDEERLEWAGPEFDPGSFDVGAGRRKLRPR